MSSLDQESAIWIVCVSLTLICVVILMIVLCIHIYNVVTIPYLEKRDTINRIAGVLTFISSICSTGVITLQFMLWFATFIGYCYPLQVTLALLWNPAKLSMQLVFVLNLHFVYKQTEYRYNPICLSFIGVSLIIVYNLLLLWTIVSLEMSPLRLSNEIGMRCNAHSGVVCALVVMSVDVVCSIGLVFAFTRPIKQMIRELGLHGQNPSTDKVLYTRTKVMVLVGTASMSTIILLLSIRILPPIGVPALTAMVYVLVPTDQVVNAVSLILLAQYYDKKQCFSYETICCCMITCCRCACGINATNPSDNYTIKKKKEIPTGSKQIPTTEKTMTKTSAFGDTTTRTLEIGSARARIDMTSTDLDQETTSLMDVDSVPTFRTDVSTFDAHP